MIVDVMPPVHRYVGRIILALRKERGLDQAQLATLTGLKQPNLSRIENGLVVPRPSTLEKIAVALSVDIKDLLSEDKAREVEAKWGAALTPKNAGQLLANRLTPVILYKTFEEFRITPRGHTSGVQELTLQIPPVVGHAFALRCEIPLPAREANQPTFKRGDVLIFTDRPDPKSGDYAYVQLLNSSVFGRIELGVGGALTIWTGVETQTYPASQILAMRRLVRRIEEF